MLKLAAADGKTLLEITDAHEPKAVGIDEVQGVVWDFGKGLLKAHGFNGELRLSVPGSPRTASFKGSMPGIRW